MIQGLRLSRKREALSTRMDEEDWAHTLAAFRACLPASRRKAEDDRRFLEALHFFMAENVRWRAPPERFGHWNSEWKRFDHLSKAGAFERSLPLLLRINPKRCAYRRHRHEHAIGALQCKGLMPLL